MLLFWWLDVTQYQSLTVKAIQGSSSSVTTPGQGDKQKHHGQRGRIREGQKQI